MRLLIILAAGVLLCSAVYGQKGGKLGKQPIAANDAYVRLEGNGIGMWLSNNGSMSHDPTIDAGGFEWPAGSQKHLIYEEGLLIGGNFNGSVRVSGSTFRYGLQAGPIRSDGSPSDASDPRYRVYRVAMLNAAEYSALPANVRQQMAADFGDWPVEDGAPWVDEDGDGLYTPDFMAWLAGDRTHDHPFFPGQEIVWYVANDLNPSRTHGLYGSMPMGLEIQVFVWSGKQNDIANRTVFTQYTIINKGSIPVEDACIARWADPDLGDANDDLVGVDTTLGMMYAYNGTPVDGVYGSAPPVLGHLWLQTPVIQSPGDVARWNRTWRQGYRNIGASAFAFYINSDPVYQDPDLGVPEGAVQMYNYLRGRLYDGSPYIDPITSRSVSVPLAGDPLTGVGWIDGVLHQPDDRRILSSCGPVTMLPGDTQQVVMATIVGVGESPLLALADLRSCARALLREHAGEVGILSPENVRYAIDWPQRDAFLLSVSADLEPTQQIAAVVRGPSGEELLRIPLYDDGQHNDGGVDDGRYAGELSHSALPTGGDLSLVALSGSRIVLEAPAGTMLPLVSELHLSDTRVISDHMDFNAQASPGENIVLQCTLENRGSRDLGGWLIVTAPSGVSASARSDLQLPAGESRDIGGMQAGLDAALQFDVPLTVPVGTELRAPITLMSEQYCLWKDTLVIAVTAPERQMFTGLLLHTDGPACGTLGYTVADLAALGVGSIRVTVEGQDYGVKTLTVRDGLGQVIASGLPAPDPYGHRSPTVAGLRLRQGSAVTEIAMGTDGLPITEDLGCAFEPEERAWFTPYAGYILYGFDFYGSTITDIFSFPPVDLVFSRSATQKAYAYLRGADPNYAYQGYFDCTLRAYDVSDPSNPRQVGLAFIEQKGSSFNDNTWCPSASPGDREHLFILNDTYSDVPDPARMVPFVEHASEMPILYGLWPILASSGMTFVDGDRYHIMPRTPISFRDTYTLDLGSVGASEPPPSQADDPALYQNYPNPFAGSTGITYRLGSAEHVELAVFDALGRRVRTLVSSRNEAGVHTVALHLEGAPAGVYYCRLTAGYRTVTRRMLLIR